MLPFTIRSKEEKKFKFKKKEQYVQYTMMANPNPIITIAKSTYVCFSFDTLKILTSTNATPIYLTKQFFCILSSNHFPTCMCMRVFEYECKYVRICVVVT